MFYSWFRDQCEISGVLKFFKYRKKLFCGLNVSNPVVSSIYYSKEFDKHGLSY